jgi:TBC1 domain family member 15
MSDLLSVIYAIMQDDSDAFWCFCGFMDRMVPPPKPLFPPFARLRADGEKYNFLMDQTGMRRQLITLKQLTQLMIPKLYIHLQKSGSDEFFFLFRQLLVWFKREFSWDDVCLLWEVLWTDALSGQFHLFVALAILDRHKEVIMGNPPLPNLLHHFRLLVGF